MAATTVYTRDSRSPVPSSEKASRMMSRIGAKDTKPELVLRRALWSAGHKGYRLHVKNLPGKPDVVFTGAGVAIFINGCFWHRCPHCSPPLPKSNTAFWKEKFRANVARDHLKASELVRSGYKVISLWECEIKASPSRCVEKVREMLDQSTIEQGWSSR